MSEHISISQWTRFFCRKASENEKLLILRHVAECETCRNLMDKANDFRFALERQKQVRQSLFNIEGMEYAAVAGTYPTSEECTKNGILTIEIEQTETGYLFVENTLETSGIGKKYAINWSEDHCELTDAGGELSILIRHDQIVLKMCDPYVQAFAKLFSAHSSTPGVQLSSETILPILSTETCSLQIVFEEE